MKKLFVLIIISISISSISIAYNWTMFGGSSNRTFFIDYSGNIHNASIVWKYYTGNPIQSSPIILNYNNRNIIIFNTNSQNGKIYAFNIDEKKMLWSKNIENYSMSHPLFYDNVIYLGNDIPWGSNSLAHFYAFNISNGNIIWERTFNGSIDTNPIIFNDKLYFGLNKKNSPLIVLNPKNGDILSNGSIYYNGNATTFPGAIMSPFSILANKLVIGVTDPNWGNKGWLFLIDPNGTVIKNVSVDGYVKSSPSIYNNTIFLGTGNGVYVFNSSLEIVTNFSTEPIQQGIYVGDIDNDNNIEIVFGVGDWFRNEEKKVYVLEFNGTSLSLEKTFNANSYIAAVPIVADINGDGNKEIVFEDRYNKTYIYDYDSGSLLKEFNISGTSPPIFYKHGNTDLIFIGSVDGNIYAIGDSFNMSILITYPNETTIKKDIISNKLDNGKDIIEKAGFNISGTTNDQWGFMLNCIDNFCSGLNLSWWSIYIKRNSDTNFVFSPVGLGPGGYINDFCWNRDLNSYYGHYCSYPNDTIKIIPAMYPDFYIKNITIDKDTIKENENFTICITVGNKGYEKGNATLVLKDNNIILHSINITNLDVDDKFSTEFTTKINRSSNLSVEVLNVEPMDTNNIDNSMYINVKIGYCGDGVCNSWENQNVCDIDCRTSVFSGNILRTIEIKNKKILKKFNFNQQISNIELEIANNENIVLDIKPITLAPNIPNIKVYKTFNITHPPINESEIKNVKINFYVENKWLENNNINRKNVYLYRYHNKSWKKLDTQLLYNTSNITYYTSYSPGLSVFSIIGKSDQKGNYNETVDKNKSTIDIVYNQNAEKPKIDIFAIFLSIIISIIAIVIAFIKFRL